MKYLIRQYPQQKLQGGRYGFGVMMKRNAEGKLAGYKMQPFNYSDSWLCGTKKYWAREKAELARVADFTAHGWGEEGFGENCDASPTAMVKEQRCSVASCSPSEYPYRCASTGSASPGQPARLRGAA